MLRRTFLANSIATTLAGLFAPMLTKLGRKPQTAVCDSAGGMLSPEQRKAFERVLNVRTECLGCIDPDSPTACVYRFTFETPHA